MGSINLYDQLRGYYAIGTKSRKWWHYLFQFCIDLSIVNAIILKQKAVNHCLRMPLKFQIKLAKDFIGDFASHGRTATFGETEAGQWPCALINDHANETSNKRRQHFAEWVARAGFPNHIGYLS